MPPRSLLRMLALLIGTSGCQPEPPADPISYSATELAERLASGELTAVDVTRAFLARIEALNRQGPALNAVLEVNPRALDDARMLDEAFARRGPAGILHGVPVVIKANIDVAGLVTSAGSMALADHRPARDAHLVARLRQAGAVVLATTNLSEWANFRDQNSSSGWSSLGGQARNPHVLDRNPCGSSSGSAIAVATRMAPLAVGTETHGSIVCPAGLNGVVGIKPSIGLISRTGIIPISHTQDTAGPMARSVVDAALLLEAMAGYDPADPASIQPPGSLRRIAGKGLNGRRIGVLRSYRGADSRPRVNAIYQDAVNRLAELGAELVDPIEFEADPGLGAAAYRVLLAEFKAGLAAYLDSHEIPADRNSLRGLIEFNEAYAGQAMPDFGQSIFVEASTAPELTDSDYLAGVGIGVRVRLEDEGIGPGDRGKVHDVHEQLRPLDVPEEVVPEPGPPRRSLDEAGK